MNRKRWTAAGILSLLLLTAMAAGAIAQTEEELETQRREKIAKARATLAGTTWTVYTALQEAKVPEEGSEVFTFTDRRVNTQFLASLGYGPGGSNYSVSYDPDGTLVWETMVKHESGEGEALLRGELKETMLEGGVTDKQLNGVIDIQPAEGERKIFFFSTDKSRLQPVVLPAAAAAEEPKKPSKRRGR